LVESGTNFGTKFLVYLHAVGCLAFTMPPLRSWPSDPRLHVGASSPQRRLRPRLR